MEEEQSDLYHFIQIEINKIMLIANNDLLLSHSEHQ
jgi:hypothetical protein